jgi:hypothetical protein
MMMIGTGLGEIDVEAISYRRCRDNCTQKWQDEIW